MLKSQAHVYKPWRDFEQKHIYYPRYLHKPVKIIFKLHIEEIFGKHLLLLLFFSLAVFHSALSTKCGFIQLLSVDVDFNWSHELFFFPSKCLLDIYKYMPLVLQGVSMIKRNNETQCNHVGCLSWHNSSFKIVDNLAVLFMPNFRFPLISTKGLETLFFSSKEMYSIENIAIFLSVLKEKTCFLRTNM